MTGRPIEVKPWGGGCAAKPPYVIPQRRQGPAPLEIHFRLRLS